MAFDTLEEYSGDDLPAKWLSAYHSFDDDDMPAALRTLLEQVFSAL